MEKTLEQNLLEEIQKRLDERRKQQEEYICNGILDRDEYAQRVGAIRQLNEIQADFEQLHKAFFPST